MSDLQTNLEYQIIDATAREAKRRAQLVEERREAEEEKRRLDECELLMWLAHDLGEAWCVACRVVFTGGQASAELVLNGRKMRMVHGDTGDYRFWSVDGHPYGRSSNYADMSKRMLDDNPHARDQLLQLIGATVGL